MFDGLPYSKLVSFQDGAPDGAVTWTLRDVSGATITTGTTTPPVGAVSVVLTVPGTHNTRAVGEPLRVLRELTWAYTTGAQVRAGVEAYFIEGRVPFPASKQGVRNLLGVPEHNLQDAEIDLIQAYWSFPDLAAFEGQNGSEANIIARGIEAKAALFLLPSMALRVSDKESSGTESFSRSRVDWGRIEEHLEALVQNALDIADPELGFVTGSIFQLTQPTDRWGAENA